MKTERPFTILNALEYGAFLGASRFEDEKVFCNLVKAHAEHLLKIANDYSDLLSNKEAERLRECKDRIGKEFAEYMELRKHGIPQLP